MHATLKWPIPFALPPQYPPEPTRIEIQAPRELFERVQMLNGKYGGWCLKWARTTLGLPPLAESARDLKPNTLIPKEGDIILLGENHAGLIMWPMGDALVYADSNADGNGRIEVGKTILVSDPRVRGFYRPNQGLALADLPQNSNMGRF